MPPCGVRTIFWICFANAERQLCSSSEAFVYLESISRHARYSEPQSPTKQTPLTCPSIPVVLRETGSLRPGAPCVSGSVDLLFRKPLPSITVSCLLYASH